MLKESDYIGKRFGRLTVIGRGNPYVSPKGKSQPTLLCICECGNKKEMRPYDLRQGNVVSCGCYRNELGVDGAFHTTHNLSGKDNKIYSVWHSMKSRCERSKNENYNCYGGRGIKVCNEWRDDYMKFHTWALTNGYKEGLQIDRIDVNGNYEPSNCRFVTPKENSRNTRTNLPLTINGETKLLTDWAKEAGISKGALSLRVSRGWPKSDWLLPIGAKPRFGYQKNLRA